jgi:hypothetical protein
MGKEDLECQLAELVAALDLCFEKGLVLPGLALLYAGIDGMAWLAKPNEGDRFGDAFCNWVTTYLLAS